MATGEDRQESALDLTNDCGWVRALDASGKSIRISKSDMVELIRANMPVVTSVKSGLIPAGQLVPFFVDLEPNQTIDIPGTSLVFMDFSGGTEMCLVSFSYWGYQLISKDSALNAYISIRNKSGNLFEIRSVNSVTFLLSYSFITL